MRTETRIVVRDLLAGLIGLSGVVFARQVQRATIELDDDTQEPDPFSVQRAVLGALSAIGIAYIDDHDVAGVRSEFGRQIGFTFGWAALQRRFGSNDPAGPLSFAFGYALGGIAYRIWFGIVRPIPEPRLEHRGLLPWRR